MRNTRSSCTSRSLRTLAGAVLLTSAATLAVATPAQAGGASCPAVSWGSLAKTSSGTPTGSEVIDVRSGQHACFDRLVIDLSGSTTGRPYAVRYVEVVTSDGSGAVVPLAGGARLEIVVQAPSYDVDSGAPTYTPADPTQLVDVGGYRTFRQVAWAGSFEGNTTIGLGVRARLPMRVFVLSGPGSAHRLVIDVAHSWTTF